MNFKATYKDKILRTGKLPQELKGYNHDLVTLAKGSNFTLTHIETGLLTRLSRNSLWQGRYPVPASADQLNSMAIHNGKAFFTAFLAPADINNLTTVIRRIKKFSSNKASAPEK